MSAITHHEIDGERIPREIAESIVFMTVGGGVDTTTALIGAALLHLSQVPDDRQRLLDDPDLLVDRDRGVPPLLSAGAHARPHRHRGLRVRRVPDAQGRPRAAQRDLVRARRGRVPRCRHVRRSTATRTVTCRSAWASTGASGSHLARIEFAEVITQILERLPDFEIDVDAVVEYPNWASVGGWAKLPATFTPGPRIATESR